jgi:two-component system chemotaxis response regulator CheY
VLIKALGLAEVPVGAFIEACNGAEALGVLRSKPVDIVFLDINMPVLNGMDFIREVRADTDLKDTPIVIYSTDGSDSRREELERAKIQGYLRKPASPERLVEIFSSILGEVAK